MKSKSPAFQFYPSDFVSDLNVLMMTAQEVGAYLLLMSHCWIEGALPNDMKVLAHIARMDVADFEASWNTRIARCFALTPDGWSHPRLQAEREKQQAFSEKMRESATRRHGQGKQAVRRQKVGTKKAEGRHQEGNALQSLSLSSSSSTTTPISPSTPPAAEHLVEAHYLATHPRRRVGSKDRGVIRRALAFGYSAAELCEAIDGNATDTWHRDKHKHELSYVLRDTGKIDDFRAKATPPDRPLVVDGWMSDELERATRPPGLRGAHG